MILIADHTAAETLDNSCCSVEGRTAFGLAESQGSPGSVIL